MATKTEICLREVATDSNRPAEFWDKILERHVNDIETVWAESLILLTATSPGVRQESAHWNWRGKATLGSKEFGYRSFAIECDSVT